jgi:hypothetical protein
MNFTETYHYGEATAKRCHSPGTPLSRWVPRSSNSSPDPITRSRSVLDTSTSFGPASALTRPDVHGDAADVIAAPPGCLTLLLQIGRADQRPAEF